ncbi:hypothetical protein [Gymnodinialimonas sp.]
MKRLYYTISAVALVAASPAMADMTAADVWADWQMQAEAAASPITADVATTDTGLTLTNFSQTLVPQEDADVVDMRALVEEVVLTENGDGTVTMTFSQPYTVDVRFDGGTDGLTILLNHENLSVVASGSPEDRTYTYSADLITAAIGEIVGPADEIPEIDLDMAITDFGSVFTLMGTEPENTRISSESAIGSITMAVEIRGPESEPGTLKVGLQIADIAETSSGSFDAVYSMATPEGLSQDAADLTADITYASLGMELQFEDPSESFAALYSNDGGRMVVGFSPEAISYDVSATGAEAMVSGAEIPVPVEISTGSTQIAFSMPVFAGEAPQDMGLRLSVQDLMVGESLLGMVDPGQAFPRDPASLLIDATGQLQLFVDLMTLDPETMTGPPGELRAITVNELNLSVGGAELAGTADFSFAPGQLVPMPVGSADLQLSGGNALMETLVAGGMVPPAQSGMIMGMANVFARPGAAPDTLETTVEFGADGSITANGVPLQ